MSAAMTLKACPTCGHNRFWVAEHFSYEAEIVDGKLHINTNDYATDGFETPECANCGTRLDDKKIEWEW